VQTVSGQSAAAEQPAVRAGTAAVFYEKSIHIAPEKGGKAL
jgi:hypothetical protein